MLTVKINGNSVECPEGSSILEAADMAGIYIPRLCNHPDLPPAQEVIWAESIYQGETKIISEKSDTKAGDEAHCNLCLVEIEGIAEPVNSCSTSVEEGMVISSESSIVIAKRKQALGKILAEHPHACLTCAQKEGCSRTDCSSNVPVEERCCKLLGQCELEKVSDYIGIPGDTPKYKPKQYPVIKDDPLFDRDYNLCIGCLRCVRACTDLRNANVMGAVWKDDKVWVGTKSAAGLKEAECRFCGACVEVCPTGALLDKDDVLAVRPDAPLPCVGKCPAGMKYPHYLRLIALGKYSEALEVIRLRVPFPGILGYVCFHPCESNCRRSEIDQPVAICDLKRFVADNASIDKLVPESQSDTGHKVAIIGSGPAGLTAAYYLRTLGHQVDIFDNAEKPGGMLRHAIPDYRLPPDVLDRELETLTKMGINFNMNSHIGAELGIPELRSQGYNVVMVSAGTSTSKALDIENSDLAGVYLGLDFLKSAKLSRKPELNGQVVVIGGGNVAIDAAMTALRLGADNVSLVCLESRDEMPAHDWEITQAEEEGIAINPSRGPKRFIAKESKLSGIELKRCTQVFDRQGRFNPKYDENEIEEIDADYAIVTIGQETDHELSAHLAKLKGTTGGRITIDDSFSTGIDDVFAAGDIVRGPSSVVEAIADGRQVADEIDKHLGGNGLPERIIDLSEIDDPKLDSSAESITRSRQTPKTSDPDTRKSNFGLITETLEEQAAKLEAQRCLQCHLRRFIRPVILPPEQWFALDEECIEAIPLTEGVFQLLDADKKIIRISGSMNLRESLQECLANPGEAKYYIWEEDPMYTKRESELIQQYLQKHGELPGGGMGDDLDDLFN